MTVENNTPIAPLNVRLALRSGKTVKVGGFTVKGINGKMHGSHLIKGDTYFAGRKSDLHLFTVSSVNIENGWVIPEGFEYVFNLNECVGVEILDVD